MQELRYPAHRDCTADGLQLQKSGTQRQPNPFRVPRPRFMEAKYFSTTLFLRSQSWFVAIPEVHLVCYNSSKADKSPFQWSLQHPPQTHTHIHTRLCHSQSCTSQGLCYSLASSIVIQVTYGSSFSLTAALTFSRHQQVTGLLSQRAQALYDCNLATQVSKESNHCPWDWTSVAPECSWSRSGLPTVDHNQHR